jgi:hypothetical protein
MSTALARDHLAPCHFTLFPAPFFLSHHKGAAIPVPSFVSIPSKPALSPPVSRQNPGYFPSQLMLSSRQPLKNN